MTVGLFQSSVIVLQVCQSWQQACYCHAPEIEPSRHRLRWSLPPRRQIPDSIFRNEDRIGISRSRIVGTIR
jgi:hypothetical protein